MIPHRREGDIRREVPEEVAQVSGLEFNNQRQ